MKRHRWTYPDGYTAADTREKTCTDCAFRGRRFGIGRDSYWDYTRDGVVIADTSRGDKIPACEPSTDPDAGLRHVNARVDGDTRPDRSTCRWCTRVIERAVGDTAWTSAKVGVDGRDPQCAAVPNPDDGSMPGHEPNGFIVHPPA